MLIFLALGGRHDDKYSRLNVSKKALNFIFSYPHNNFLCFCHSQMFELCYIFTGHISKLYMILSQISLLKHETFHDFAEYVIVHCCTIGSYVEPWYILIVCAE